MSIKPTVEQHACLVNGKFIYSSYRHALAATGPLAFKDKEKGKERKRGHRTFKNKGRVTIGENEYRRIDNGQSLGNLLADLLAFNK